MTDKDDKQPTDNSFQMEQILHTQERLDTLSSVEKKQSEMITFKINNSNIRVSIYKSQIESVGSISNNKSAFDTKCGIRTKSGDTFTVEGSRESILKQLGVSE